MFDEKDVLRGLVNADALHALALQPEVESWIVADDLMQRSAFVRPEDDLAMTARTMLEHDLRALPVVKAKGEMIGFVDQSDIASAYVEVDDRRSAAREAGTETNPPSEPPTRATR